MIKKKLGVIGIAAVLTVPTVGYAAERINLTDFYNDSPAQEEEVAVVPEQIQQEDSGKEPSADLKKIDGEIKGEDYKVEWKVNTNNSTAIKVKFDVNGKEQEFKGEEALIVLKDWFSEQGISIEDMTTADWKAVSDLLRTQTTLPIEEFEVTVNQPGVGKSEWKWDGNNVDNDDQKSEEIVEGDETKLEKVEEDRVDAQGPPAHAIEKREKRGNSEVAKEQAPGQQRGDDEDDDDERRGKKAASVKKEQPGKKKGHEVEEDNEDRDDDDGEDED
ncbi:hypothetical protein [Bacillus fonticola]|uniref:hypothetical protein n=1 Tax=Bacillus fonticola TaxID=2728853 RepID=UPI0014736385|nr:hypothetical protein [Bacillus fonticola]